MCRLKKKNFRKERINKNKTRNGNLRKGYYQVNFRKEKINNIREEMAIQ